MPAFTQYQNTLQTQHIQMFGPLRKAFMLYLVVCCILWCCISTCGQNGLLFIFNVVYRHVVRMGCCIYKSFPFYQSSIGSNARSPFCEMPHRDYPQATVAGPIALGRGSRVGDGKDGVVVCMSLFQSQNALGVLSWIKQNQSFAS